MRVTIIGGGAVQHSGELYLPGSVLECDDIDGNYLINSGVASLVDDPASTETVQEPEAVKTGGGKKGK